MSYLEKLFGLKGKVVIVTGGSRGIGQTVAIGMARAGAEVAIFSRTEATETVDTIVKEGGVAYSLLVDVTNEKRVDEAVSEVMKRSGSIDVVFSNAGACIHKDTFSASLREWSEIINVNLTGVYIIARATGRVMADHKIKGSIINMASMSGGIVNVPQWQASYNASKAGVIHLTRSLAIEWADLGIRVNSLSPGYIATPMSVDTPQELKDAWMPLIPLHRMGDPEELMTAVLYLASNASGYTTGSDVLVDGAYSCL
jgi:sorbose reductase